LGTDIRIKEAQEIRRKALTWHSIYRLLMLYNGMGHVKVIRPLAGGEGRRCLWYYLIDFWSI